MAPTGTFRNRRYGDLMAQRTPPAPSLREERRRQQEELSRLHLLDAAEAVFAEKGFAGATVKEIAERSELSVGSVYQLFDGKEALFRGVMRRRNQEVNDLLDDVISRSESAAEQLHELIDAYIDWFTDHEDYYRLFQRAIGSSWLNLKSGFDETNFEQYENILATEAAMFALGIKQGHFRDLGADAMAVIFAGMTQAYLAHCIVGVSDQVRIAKESFPVSEFHALVDRSFAAPKSRRGRD